MDMNYENGLVRILIIILGVFYIIGLLVKDGGAPLPPMFEKMTQVGEFAQPIGLSYLANNRSKIRIHYLSKVIFMYFNYVGLLWVLQFWQHKYPTLKYLG